jgi:hypothetical protein
VTVYHPDRAQAEKIDRAINYVLMTQNTAYHGSGNAVKIRLIDQPITSSFPVQPNIPLILSLAAALGFVFSLIYIYLLPQSVYAPHVYGQHAPYAHKSAAPSTPSFRPQEMTAHMSRRAGEEHEIGFNVIDEGGYWEDSSEPTPEEIARRGNIKNIIS